MTRWCVPTLLALIFLAASCPAADYADVHAILAASCIRCHGPDKAKGDLRLDTLDNIRKGGKSGPAVVPGFPDDSAIYARTSLPADDPDIMPAKGAHLSQRQLETIAAWIKAGATAASNADGAPAADPGQTVAAATPSPVPAPAPAPAAGSAGDPPTMTGAADAPAAPMAPTSAMEPAASAASAGGGGASFADVEAILAVSCLQCHGPSKSKAKLRLDSLQGILSGGKSGPAVVPGSPGKSLLIQRISLSPDDSDVMPADGKVLTAAQIATIASWISAGATEGSASSAGAAPVDPNAPLHPVIPPGQTGPAAAGPPPPTKPWDPASAPDTDLDVLAKGMSPPDAKKLDALKAANIWWRPVCKNGALIELDCRQLLPDSLPAQLGGLGALAPRVVWLNLAGTAISDGQLGELKSCTNLKRLHLERTTVSDTGLAAVAGHTTLTYLNLYGTPVTDDGILKLAPLAHLEQLFLRGTKATPDGAAKLKEKIPGLTIIFDEDLPTGPLPEKKKGKGKNNN